MSLARIVFVLLLLAVLPSAQAHSLGTSFSQWRLAADGEAEVTARVSTLQLSRLQLDPRYTPNYAAEVGAVLARDLQLWSASARCEPADVQARETDDGWVEASWRLHCTEPGARRIRTRLFEAVAPSHLHFVRADVEGQPPVERLLSFAEPSLVLSTEPPAQGSLRHFIGIGIAHILGGWDHLAFVLMLILLAASLREVALVASGFTLAHSLTLAAATLGWVHVEQGRIEAMIGFSILLVAAENLWLRSARDVWIARAVLIALLLLAVMAYGRMPLLMPLALLLFTASYFGLLARVAKPQRLRLALAFVFGLVHGFGFAGLMGELALPPAQLAIGLLGFNLGVECGQLLVIALIWPLLLALRRMPRLSERLPQVLSAAVAGLGTSWLFGRLLG